MIQFDIAFGIRKALLEQFLSEALTPPQPSVGDPAPDHLTAIPELSFQGGPPASTLPFSLSVNIRPKPAGGEDNVTVTGQASFVDETSSVSLRVGTQSEATTASSSFAAASRVALGRLLIQLPRPAGATFGGYDLLSQDGWLYAVGRMLYPHSGSPGEFTPPAAGDADVCCSLSRRAYEACLIAAVESALREGGAGQTAHSQEGVSTYSLGLGVDDVRSVVGDSGLEVAVSVSGGAWAREGRSGRYVPLKAEGTAELSFNLRAVCGSLFLAPRSVSTPAILAEASPDAPGGGSSQPPAALGTVAGRVASEMFSSLAPQLWDAPRLAIQLDGGRVAASWVGGDCVVADDRLLWTAKALLESAPGDADDETYDGGGRARTHPGRAKRGVAPCSLSKTLYMGAKAGDALTGGIFTFNVYKQAGEGFIKTLSDTMIECEGSYDINEKIGGQEIKGRGQFRAKLNRGAGEFWEADVSVTGAWETDGAIRLTCDTDGQYTFFYGEIEINGALNEISVEVWREDGPPGRPSYVYASASVEPAFGLLPTFYVRHQIPTADE